MHNVITHIFNRYFFIWNFPPFFFLKKDSSYFARNLLIDDSQQYQIKKKKHTHKNKKQKTKQQQQPQQQHLVGHARWTSFCSLFFTSWCLVYMLNILVNDAYEVAKDMINSR